MQEQMFLDRRYDELFSYPVVFLVGDLLAISALEGHVRSHVPGYAVNPDIVTSLIQFFTI